MATDSFEKVTPKKRLEMVKMKIQRYS